MGIFSVGWNTVNETGKYTCATVEYAVLLSYSMIKTAGILVTGGVRKVTMPVAAAVCWPYDCIKDKTGSVFSKKGHKERIKGLTERLAQIEERLANIEKYGVIPASGEADALRKKKALTKDKRSVLKRIFEETKALKAME